jgi:hypothetical protein
MASQQTVFRAHLHNGAHGLALRDYRRAVSPGGQLDLIDGWHNGGKPLERLRRIKTANGF